MSLINDALIKAERDRAEEAAARAAALRPHERVALRRQAKKTRSLGFVVANTAALVLIFGALIAVLVRNRQPLSATPNPTVASAETPAASPARREAMSPSPVMSAPEPEPVALPKPPPAPYELAGMSALGKDTLLSILRRSDRRSIWVPVGKTVGEITAVSYDPHTDKAVIRVDDELFTLPLRTGSADEPPVQAAE